MACVYTVNGVADELVTNIYQLIEDTNPQTELLRILRNLC